MAQVAKVEAEAQTKSSSDKIYSFFKNNISQLAEIFPQRIKSVAFVEGDEGSEGTIMLVKYELGRLMSANVKTEAIDDGEKSIAYEILQGDVMQLYTIFKAKVIVSEGSVKWSFEFEKANDSAPNPDAYAAVAVEVSKVLDAYLLNH